MPIIPCLSHAPGSSMTLTMHYAYNDAWRRGRGKRNAKSLWEIVTLIFVQMDIKLIGLFDEIYTSVWVYVHHIIHIIIRIIHQSQRQRDLCT